MPLSISILIAFTSIGPTTFAGDRAIVVGIPDYPNLPSASKLPGCANDANDFAELLKSRAFHVVLLNKPENTTKDQIIGAITNEQQLASAGKGKFVFYFAGHGRADKPGLMPRDARDGPANDISPEKLLELVENVPAVSRTVILDACYSGALAKGDGGYHVRSYQSNKTKSIPIIEGSGWPDSASSKVCYYTATNGVQPAVETQIEGTDHGVFTYELIKTLKNPPKVWGALDSSVQGGMMEILKPMGVLESPTLTAQFRNKPVFGSSAAPAETLPPPKVVLDMFALNSPDPTRLKLSLEPSMTFYYPGEKVKFRAICGEKGWLVLVDRSAGRYQVMFPPRPSDPNDLGAWTSAARVDLGEVPLPKEFYTLEPGTDFIKGFWFASEARARAWLSTLKSIDLQSDKVMTKELVPVEGTDSPTIVTGVQEVQISDLLAGDMGRVGNLPNAFKRFFEDRDLQTVLYGNVPEAISCRMSPYLGEDHLPADKHAGDLMLAMINVAVSQVSTSPTPLISDNLAPEYLAQHPLKPDLVPPESKRTGLNYSELNVKILRALFLGPPPVESKGGVSAGK